MELYNSLINDTLDALKPYPFKVWKQSDNMWQTVSRNEVLFQKETAYELGSGNKNSVNFAAITSNKDILPYADRILLFGKDMDEIKSDSSFAQIALIVVDDFSDDAMACYNAIKDIEFVIYDCFPKSVMTRVSAFDKRISTRVGKQGLKEGINFERYGNLIASKYKSNAKVISVCIIFITDDLPIFPKLTATAHAVDDITRTLNHVLNDMNFDCQHCNLKAICDQVEGMRELHFKNKK